MITQKTHKNNPKTHRRIYQKSTNQLRRAI